MCALWTGWRVEAPNVRIDWTGGLRGGRTRIKGAAGKAVREGLLSTDEALTVAETLR